ncbi:MAG: hypothetical protein IT279_08710 [Ignavibacteriaceae bacterium]|nr:hypothetical protein [Ignavibacteriaceae bacterium]
MKKKTASKKSAGRRKKSPVARKQDKAKKLIASRVAEAMEAKNWKPTDLVTAMKKDNSTLVYTWLSGTHNFTVNSLIELEKALGINLLAEGISAARKKRTTRSKKKS